MILSRRDFLKLSGLAFGAALLPPPPLLEEAPRRAQFLGRNIYAVYIYDRPSFNARQLGLIQAESVFNIYATVTSEDDYYNRTWYQVQRGYVHSASVQPVRWQLQTPLRAMPETSFLGEVTVPFTLAKAGPRAGYNTLYKAYYETTYWVEDITRDEDGLTWYKILDDRTLEYSWIRAEHLRRVRPDELTPISPEVLNKRIEIDLEQQRLRAYEGDTLVLDTLTSTGPFLRVEDGRRVWGTPAGDWRIDRKRPTRHMAGDDLASPDFFDLPGVPWVSYFHWWGVSFHGTYWHNDYGRARSHGCINLLPQTAKWVYRWTLPVAPPGQLEFKGQGTQVVVY